MSAPEKPVQFKHSINFYPVSCMENNNELDCFVGKTDTYHCMSNNVSKLNAHVEYFSPGEGLHSSCAQ